MADTEETVSRSQMWKHEDAYEWLLSEGLISKTSTGPEIIAAFAANRNAYRKTDRYRSLVESHADVIASEREQAKAERAEKRAAEKAERDAERAAAKEAKAAEREAAKASKAAAPAKKAAKATKATKATKKAAATKGDDPFA